MDDLQTCECQRAQKELFEGRRGDKNLVYHLWVDARAHFHRIFLATSFNAKEEWSRESLDGVACFNEVFG